MQIQSSLLNEMVDHALEQAPDECCGIIASAEGIATRIFRARNVAPTPYLRYELDAKEQFVIQSTIEEAGLQLGGIYHSHTHTRPYPSQTDIDLAFYPDALYVIIGLAGERPEVCAFNIVEGNVSVAALTVVEGDDAMTNPHESSSDDPVKVAYASNQAEAELIQGLLRTHGIPSFVRRSMGFDVPDFLAAGPRDVMVRSSSADQAREVLREAHVEWESEDLDDTSNSGSTEDRG